MPAPAAVRSVTGMNTHQPVISVGDLRMRYGKHEALPGLSFEVHRGELFALLGPNGAGNTSTVEILEGYRRRVRRPRPPGHGRLGPRRHPPVPLDPQL
jgi:ABC-type uncharacterized transport system ATPase subunit